MADRAFTAADQDQLLAAFAQVESEHLGAGTHQKYLRVADELADRYGVAKATPAPAPSRPSACGH